jgi:hypothetical protein
VILAQGVLIWSCLVGLSQADTRNGTCSGHRVRAPRDYVPILRAPRIWAARGPRWAAKKGSKSVREANKRTGKKRL